MVVAGIEMEWEGREGAHAAGTRQHPESLSAGATGLAAGLETQFVEAAESLLHQEIPSAGVAGILDAAREILWAEGQDYPE